MTSTGTDDRSRQFAFWVLVVLFVAEYPRPDLIAALKVQLLGLGILTILLLANGFGRVKSPVLVALTLFCLVVAKSLLHCVNHFSAFIATKSVIGYLIVVFGLAWVSTDDKLRSRLIDVWVLLLVYCCVYAIFHGGRGPGGLMGDENDLSLAGAIGFSFGLFGATTLRGIKRILYAASVPLFLGAVMASQSRGGFLAGGAVLVYFLWRQPGFGKKLVFPLIAAGMFLTFAPEQYKNEIFSLDKDIQETNDGDSTISKRFYLWAAGINMFLDNPILGVGAQNYTWHVHEYQPRGGNWPIQFTEQDMSMQASHSTYIDILSELGLPGALLWLYIVFATFAALFRLARDSVQKLATPEGRTGAFEAQALAGALVAYLAGAVSLAVAYYPYLWYLVGLSLGLAAARKAVVSAQPGSGDVAVRTGRVKRLARVGRQPLH